MLVVHLRRVAVHVAVEGLVPGVDDLDRLAGVLGQQAGVDLHRDVLAAAEGPADAGQGQPDLLLGQVEHRSHLLAVHVQPLGGDVEVDAAVLGGHGEAGLGAEEGLVLHADLVVAADDDVRQRPHLVRHAAAGDQPLLVADVAVRVRLVLVRLVDVAVRLRVEALLLGDDRGEHLVLDRDLLHRAAGRFRVVGGDQRDRLAVVPDLVDGQGRLVLDLQAVVLRAGDVLVREHRVDAGHLERLGDVHREDVGAGVRRAQRHTPQHVLVPQVRGVGELALDLQVAVRAQRRAADAVLGRLVDVLQVLLALDGPSAHSAAFPAHLRADASRTASMIFS